MALTHVLVPIVQVIVSGIQASFVFVLLLVIGLGLLYAACPGTVIVQEKPNIRVSVHVV
jgi:hypothetical protein